MLSSCCVGAIKIGYQAMMISNSSQGDVLEATAGVDFNDANMTVDLLDGQPSTTILAPVINVRNVLWYWLYIVSLNVSNAKLFILLNLSGCGSRTCGSVFHPNLVSPSDIWPLDCSSSWKPYWSRSDDPTKWQSSRSLQFPSEHVINAYTLSNATVWLFALTFNRANISENTGMVNLPVQRDAGTFGIVGVLYLISRTSTDINDFSAVTSGVNSAQ